MNEIPDPVVATASEYFRQGMLDEAGVLCEGLLAKAPRHYPAILLLSFIRARSGRLDEAVRLMKKAVKLKPRDADTLFRLGNLLIGQGSRGEAIISYDKALALNPGLVEAHVNRSNVLRELGRFDEAVAGYDRVLAIDSKHALARSNRFVCLLGRLKDIDVALAEGIAVAQANSHASRAEACATGSNSSISAFRLKHDLEQCAYLLAAGLEFDGLRESHSALASLYAKHLAGRPFDGNQRLDLLTNEMDSVEIFRRSLYLYRQPVAVDNCLNEDNDWPAIEQRYFSSNPEIIHIDNFLSRQALAAFRQFCLASTVWTAEYGNLYLGAFFDRGFISLLHLKLARELQARMPRIFGGHTLEDCWAFKYDSSMRKGTGVHADFAKVNLNFWITPDEANLDPASGGLLVYDVPAPKSWAPATYNGDTARIYGFLAEQRAKTVAVPYRCNRAVLFNSALFHETDSFQFKEGYENRRINLTYLFGGGLKRESQWV